jgi:hypothetical protein
VIVWLDADLRSYTDDYLTNLIEPLDNDDAIALVRPDYPRTLDGHRRVVDASPSAQLNLRYAHGIHTWPTSATARW